MKRLKGKSALITGAARGIGRGFAQKYIDEGAQVAIADSDLDAAKKTASELGAAAYPIHIDVSDQNSIEAAISHVVAQTKKLDILINNCLLYTSPSPRDLH